MLLVKANHAGLSGSEGKAYAHAKRDCFCLGLMVVTFSARLNFLPEHTALMKRRINRTHGRRPQVEPVKTNSRLFKNP